MGMDSDGRGAGIFRAEQNLAESFADALVREASTRGIRSRHKKGFLDGETISTIATELADRIDFGGKLCIASLGAPRSNGSHPVRVRRPGTTTSGLPSTFEVELHVSERSIAKRVYSYAVHDDEGMKIPRKIEGEAVAEIYRYGDGSVRELNRRLDLAASGVVTTEVNDRLEQPDHLLELQRKADFPSGDESHGQEMHRHADLCEEFRQWQMDTQLQNIADSVHDEKCLSLMEIKKVYRESRLLLDPRRFRTTGPGNREGGDSASDFIITAVIDNAQGYEKKLKDESGAESEYDSDARSEDANKAGETGNGVTGGKRRFRSR